MTLYDTFTQLQDPSHKKQMDKILGSPKDHKDKMKGLAWVKTIPGVMEERFYID